MAGHPLLLVHAARIRKGTVGTTGSARQTIPRISAATVLMRQRRICVGRITPDGRGWASHTGYRHAVAQWHAPDYDAAGELRVIGQILLEEGAVNAMCVAVVLDPEVADPRSSPASCS